MQEGGLCLLPGPYLIILGLPSRADSNAADDAKYDRAMTTDTGRPLAGFSTEQVPRWSLTFLGEALDIIQLSMDRLQEKCFFFFFYNRAQLLSSGLARDRQAPCRCGLRPDRRPP